MSAETHSQLANFIWSICNLLRGPYKRNEYRKVILPLTVLRRFDCLLAPTKEKVLKEYPAIKGKHETVVRSLLQRITKRPFYNLSKLDFAKLLNDPNQLGEIAKIHGNFRDGETRAFAIDGQQKTLVVSKIFDNADLGFHKITIERPLRLNFQASAERIARIKDESGFKNLATSNKKNEKVRLQEIADGEGRQEEIRRMLCALAEISGGKLYMDRESFLADLKSAAQQRDVRLNAAELKSVLNALGERDETAEICRDKDGNPEPDPELRDTETVPLKVSIEAYFKREVLPHVPDAWIDHSKTKVGYEIPLNRHFYRYEPPRPLEEIEADIKTLEGEILALLKEVTA